MARLVVLMERHRWLEFWPNFILFGSMILVGLLPSEYSKIASMLLGPCAFLFATRNFKNTESKNLIASSVSVRASEGPSIEDYTRFMNLASQWHNECGSTSSIEKMVMSYSYQRIIAMGDKAVPLILQQIERDPDEPDHWFWALRVLTGANPVSENDRGDMKAMARSWLEWGRTHYAW